MPVPMSETQKIFSPQSGQKVLVNLVHSPSDEKA